MTIVDTLRDEHRNIARLLDVLERQVQIVAEDTGPDYELLEGIADYFCDYPDYCHHPKEDAVFNQLRTTHPKEAAAIGDLAREHCDAAARVRRFRQNMQALVRDEIIARDTLVSAARSFVDAERRHMQFEEEFFFPLVEKEFGPDDWRAVERHLKSDHDPLFENQAEQRFRVLRERLLTCEYL
jgi:hemerythrin-like domain-containing protein